VIVKGAVASYCGLGLLGIAGALAAALMLLPPPSHIGTVVCGIAVLMCCGGWIAAYSLRRSVSALVMVVSLASLIAAMLAARSAATQCTSLPLTIEANDRTCVVSVSGDFANNLYRDLQRTLDAHPGSRAVLLDSAGGSALAITHVAGLLRDHGVDTAIMHDQCDSACAFLWASVPRRIIAGPRSTLAPGFHAPHIALPWLGVFRATVQDHQQRAYLRSVGLPDDFIGWAYTPVGALWRPDVKTLNHIGVPAEFVSTRSPEKLSFCSI
jgi:hypothetical protein